MKKYFRKSISAVLFLFLIAGCKNFLDAPSDDRNSAKKSASISVQVGKAARQIDPTGYEESISSIVLTGKLKGGETQTIKTWQSTEKSGRVESAFRSLAKDPTIDNLDTGEWEFTLTCSGASGVVCAGTTTKTLVAGDNVIHFDLVNEIGEGTLEITLDYSSAAEKDTVTKIVATVKTLAGNTTNEKTYESGSFVPEFSLPRDGKLSYTATVQNGSYMVLFTIYVNQGGRETTTTAAELVNVAKDYKTTGTIALTNLNKSCSINYMYAYQEFNDTTNEWETKIEPFDPEWSISGTLPLTFTEYDTIVLPGVNDIIRYEEAQTPATGAAATSGKGYIFAGWYTSPDFLIEVKTISGTENQTVYAKFFECELGIYGGDETTPYYGREKQVDMPMIFSFPRTGKLPDSWYTDIAWTSSNTNVLEVAEHGTPHPTGTNQICLSSKATGFGNTTITATVNGKTIGKLNYTVSSVFGQSIYRELLKEIATDKTDFSDITSFEIPEGYTEIANDQACILAQNLEKIVIPSTVTSIGDNAFVKLTNLKTVVMNSLEPPTLSSNDPFNECDALEAIRVPNAALAAYQNVCANSKKGWKPAYGDILQNMPFTNDTLKADLASKNLSASTIEYYTIPAGYTSIAADTFSDCGNLKGVVVSEYVRMIDADAFNGCANLESVTLKRYDANSSFPITSIVSDSNVTGAPDSFNGCNKLAAIYVADGTDATAGPGTLNTAYSNGWQSTNYQEKLKSSTLTNSVLTSLGYDETSTNIEIPYGYTMIYNNSSSSNIFGKYSDGGTALTTLIIPESVEEIGAAAFYYCTVLTEITIPGSVETIGEKAFYNCYGLKRITISDGVKTIGKEAFNVTTKSNSDPSAVSIESISISKSVESIGEKAFAYWNYNRDPSAATKFTLTFTQSENPAEEMVIGSQAFWNCTGLEELVLPNNIKYLGTAMEFNSSLPEQFFYNCKNLKSVEFESGSQLESIGSSAFNTCTALSKVTLPDSVQKIGYATFQDSIIETITIPAKVNEIGQYAFSNCNSLKSITIPGRVKTIGQYAFNECTSLESVEIQEGMETIGEYAFYRCSSLETVTLPRNLKSIKNYAFQNCSALTTVKGAGLKDGELPDGLTELGTGAFSYCRNLAKITIPGSVESIGTTSDGTGVFESCSGLQEIIIKDGVKTIGKYAFVCLSSPYNTNITRIDIPKSVETIGQSAFRYMQYNSTGTFTLTFTSGDHDADKMTIKESAFQCCHGLKNVTLPNNLITLETGTYGYAFGECKDLETVAFEEDSKLNLIGKNAFYKCSKLKNITIPGCVKTIGEMAFYYCTGLKEIIIEDGVETIEKQAFYSSSASAINRIEISKSVKEIGEEAFHYWNYNSTSSAAQEFTLTFTQSRNPAREMVIGKSAFKQCTGLKTLELPNNIVSLGDDNDSQNDYFYRCENLKSVTFEEGSKLTSIGDTAFSYCTALEDVSLPEGLLTIGYSAFSGTALKSITIPESVTIIGKSAFSYCEQLASVTIPEGVTSLGNYAFNGCTSLETVTMKPTTPPTLGTNVFGSCDSLTTFYVPNGCSQAYQDVCSIGSNGWDANYSGKIQEMPQP